MQGSKLIIKNTGILYAKVLITMGMSLVSTRLVLNALGASDLGIFNLVAGVIAMLTFLNNAMASATQRFMSHSHGSNDQDAQHQIFNASVFLHLIIGLVVVLVIEAGGYFAFDHFLKIPPDRLSAAKFIFHFMVASTFLTIISVPYDAILNAKENMLFYSILGIAESISVLSIALFITSFSGDRLMWYGALVASMTFVLLIVRRVYCSINYKESKINFKHYLKTSTIGSMASFASWSFLGAISSIIGAHGITLILNTFFGTAVNAAQGIAMQLNGQFSVFSNTMLKALNPQIVKSEGGGERQRMLSLALVGTKFSIFLLAIFAIPFILEAPFVLTLWLKNPPPNTIVFCRLLLVISIVRQLSFSISTVIDAVGKIRQYALFSSIINLMGLPITYIFFRLGFPSYYVYLVYLFMEFVVVTFRLYMANKMADLSLKDYLEVVLKPVAFVLFSTFFIAFLPYHFLEDGFLRLVLTVVVSTLSFGISVYFVGLNQNEREMIQTMLSKITKKTKGVHKSLAS